MIGFVDNYRAKTVDHSRWVYGTFCQRVCEDGDSIIPCISVIHENDYGDWIENVEVDGNTVGQDIHILDANRNHLYEGDIVQFKNPCGKVAESYNYIIEIDNHKGFVGHSNDCKFYINENDVENKCVRVGNIFDNPEMVRSAVNISNLSQC